MNKSGTKKEATTEMIDKTEQTRKGLSLVLRSGSSSMTGDGGLCQSGFPFVKTGKSTYKGVSLGS